MTQSYTLHFSQKNDNNSYPFKTVFLNKKRKKKKCLTTCIDQNYFLVHAFTLVTTKEYYYKCGMENSTEEIRFFVWDEAL